jgi:hypothetical protein
MEYSLSLALVDFLPVFFSGIGFMYIIRLVSYILPMQGRIALWGSILVVTGGFFKALWKLLMALSDGEVDINWMENGLFVFMTPGYILLAWSVWQTARSVQGKRTYSAWALPLGLITVIFLVSFYFFRTNPASPAWERVLLSMMVLATVVTGALLTAFAFRLNLYLAAGLFVVNLVGIFVLNGLARLPAQPISLQWIEEGINTVTWLAFAIGAWILYRYARLSFAIDVSIALKLSTPAK